MVETYIPDCYNCTANCRVQRGGNIENILLELIELQFLDLELHICSFI